jgi:type IV secretory pathway TrbD component
MAAWSANVREGSGMGLEKGSVDEKLDRAELLVLHEYYATEMRASLDFAHRNLSFYVGLLSAILAAVLAGILKAGTGDLRALWLLAGPGLAVWLAEVGYSTVKVFYHRFIDAYLTLRNIQRMLRLDDSKWIAPGIALPFIPSKYGGFIAQWVGAVEWLEDHRQLNAEVAKQAILEEQMVTPAGALRYLRRKRPGFPAITLRDARVTMWAFELASLLLVAAIIVTGLS